MNSLRDVSLSRIGKKKSYITEKISGTKRVTWARDSLPLMLRNKTCGALFVDDYRLSSMNIEESRKRKLEKAQSMSLN
ncbi:hypothetical protein [Agarilytica rhodophyticola]|uniref:hypothetical protein n=1 Tax=Agarilytica rhodophyticola TaxID=1737490 RepID=UPI000B3437AD|nr:hypothetical protein [Agarilytica rhodophyticola]